MTNQSEQPNDLPEADAAETIEQRRRALLAKLAAGALATPAVLAAIVSQTAASSI